MNDFLEIIAAVANGDVDEILIDDIENAYQKAVSENPKNEKFLFELKQTLVSNASYLKLRTK